MGGGDLNLKKSWHPTTFKNQKRVWEAEQADKAEKQKLAELQREIQHERNFEDLKKIGQSSGVLAADNNKGKLEWMYKASGSSLNREEYLTGRAVDKHFEDQDAVEKKKQKANLVGVTAPINHVEHECIPFSIRAFKAAPDSGDQVDMQLKMMEDPLMAIRQREMDSRKKLLENPVKLKEIHRLLEADKKLKSSSHKSKKKSKKSKKKRSRSGSDSDSDLDALLAKKYKNVLNDEDKLTDKQSVDKLFNEKYEKISKELDRMRKSKKPKKSKKSNKKHRDSSGSDSSDDERNTKTKRKDDGKRDDRKKRDDAPTFNRANARHNPSRRDSPFRRDSPVRERNTNRRQRSRSPIASARNDDRHHRRPDKSIRDQYYGRNRSRSPSHSSTRKQPKQNNRRESPDIRPIRTAELPPNMESTKRSRKSSTSSDSSSKSGNTKQKPLQNYGLVSASGEKIAFKIKEPIKRASPVRRETEQKNPFAKPASNVPRKKLTEDEKQSRIREMQQNAQWHEREQTVSRKRHEKETERDKEAEKNTHFDQSYIHKEMNKALNDQGSIEARIKSNLNNIQRMSSSMQSHFTRK